MRPLGAATLRRRSGPLLRTALSAKAAAAAIKVGLMATIMALLSPCTRRSTPKIGPRPQKTLARSRRSCPPSELACGRDEGSRLGGYRLAARWLVKRATARSRIARPATLVNVAVLHFA